MAGQWRSRVRQLRRNAGTFGVIRVCFVGLMLPFAGVMILIHLGDPTPLICLLVGACVPVLSRRSILEDVEGSTMLARYFGFTLAGAGMAFGFAKERVLAVVSEALLLDALFLAVGVYLSLFVVLHSDPDVVFTDP